MTGTRLVFWVVIFNKAIKMVSGKDLGVVISSTITTWCYKVSMKVVPAMGVTGGVVDDSNRDNVIDLLFITVYHVL